MTLVKWNKPGNERVFGIPSLMDNIFGRDMEELFGFGHMLTNGKTTPSVNIKETKDSFMLEVAAPGMKKDDFNIEVEKNVLTISSEKESKNVVEEEGSHFTRREYSYSSFSRSFTLPQTTDSDRISASYVDGVLNVSIPKKEEAKEKPVQKIEVK